MAKKDKGKVRRRGWDPDYMFKTRVELPTSKGKFRNMFPEMVPKPKRTCDCGLPIRDEAESK